MDKPAFALRATADEKGEKMSFWKDAKLGALRGLVMLTMPMNIWNVLIVFPQKPSVLAHFTLALMIIWVLDMVIITLLAVIDAVHEKKGIKDNFIHFYFYRPVGWINAVHIIRLHFLLDYLHRKKYALISTHPAVLRAQGEERRKMEAALSRAWEFRDFSEIEWLVQLARTRAVDDYAKKNRAMRRLEQDFMALWRRARHLGFEVNQFADLFLADPTATRKQVDEREAELRQAEMIAQRRDVWRLEAEAADAIRHREEKQFFDDLMVWASRIKSPDERGRAECLIEDLRDVKPGTRPYRKMLYEIRTILIRADSSPEPRDE